MKKVSIILTGVIMLFAVFATTAFRPTTTGKSVNGQGTLTLPGDITRHFAFHANTMPDGSVQGSGELTYTAGGLKIKFDINCMNIVGNTAILSGVITSNDENPAAVGYSCWFKVRDNGEGFNAAPDRMTLLYSAPVLGNCDFNYPYPLNPIEGGNIQVK